METDADVLAAIDVNVFPDGQAVAREAIFGNSASFDDNGALSGAEAFMQVCGGCRAKGDSMQHYRGEGE